MDTEVPVAEPITAAFYDRIYFAGPAAGEQSTSNYRGYGPASQPHWCLPLARWLARHVEPPVLELGCAFGFLERSLAQLGCPAIGVEWSPWATQHAVSPHVLRADARELSTVFASHDFGAVVSLDFLEHLVPEDAISVMAQAVALLRPGGRMVHLIGVYDADAPDASHHFDDPSHLSALPLAWYREQFEAVGMTFDRDATAALNAHPAWAGSDWRGRWLALRDGRAH